MSLSSFSLWPVDLQSGQNGQRSFIASLIVGGIIRGRETNIEDLRTLTLDQDLSIVASDDFLALGSP